MHYKGKNGWTGCENRFRKQVTLQLCSSPDACVIDEEATTLLNKERFKIINFRSEIPGRTVTEQLL